MLLLAHLELHGLVCSGVPRDGEHTYALFADRVPAPRRLDRDEALTELALRYFTSHGPATERDLAYWATLTVTDVRRGVAGAADGLASFEHDGRTFWHAPGDLPACRTRQTPTCCRCSTRCTGATRTLAGCSTPTALVPRVRETAIGMALVDGQLVAAMKRTVGREGGHVRGAAAPRRSMRVRSGRSGMPRSGTATTSGSKRGSIWMRALQPPGPPLAVGATGPRRGGGSPVKPARWWP